MKCKDCKFYKEDKENFLGLEQSIFYCSNPETFQTEGTWWQDGNAIGAYDFDKPFYVGDNFGCVNFAEKIDEFPDDAEPETDDYIEESLIESNEDLALVRKLLNLEGKQRTGAFYNLGLYISDGKMTFTGNKKNTDYWMDELKKGLRNILHGNIGELEQKILAGLSEILGSTEQVSESVVDRLKRIVEEK